MPMIFELPRPLESPCFISLAMQYAIHSYQSCLFGPSITTGMYILQITALLASNLVPADK